MDEKQKQIIEDVRDSKYFDFVVETKVKEKLAELFKKYYRILSVVLSAVVIVGGYLGWSWSQLGKELEKYSAKQKEVDSLVGVCQGMIDNVQAYVDMQKEVLEDRKRLNEDIRIVFDQSLEHLNQLNIDEKLRAFEGVRSEMNSSDSSTKASLKSIESVRTSIQPTVKRLDSLSGDIQMASSVRQLIVERGDRDPSGKEFRPTRIKLPFSEDTLEARFHTAIRTHTPKVVLVDLFRNGQVLCPNLVLTDRERRGDEFDCEFCSTEGNKTYGVKCVFIYLPPNIPVVAWVRPFGVIPDYVTLEVRLVKMTCDPETLGSGRKHSGGGR